LDTALQKFNAEDPKNKFISLNPTISFELDRRKIPHTTTLNYGGSDERYRNGIKAYSTVNKILEEIDTKLSDGSVDCPIKTATYSFHHIKNLFDVIQTNIHLLMEIIAQERPEKIITFGSSSSQPQGIIPFSNDESVFAQLLALDGWNIPVICFPTEKTIIPTPLHHVKENRFRHFLIKNSTLFNMAMIVKRKGLKYLVHVAISSLLYKKIPVVVYGSGYNWDDALVELYCAGFHPIIRYHNINSNAHLIGNERKIQESIEKICKENVFINNCAIIYGVDARPLIFKRLSIILARTFIESITAYLQFSIFLQKQKPKCLLLSTQAYHIDRATIKSAHDYGIKAISWQHGGAGYGYHPMMPFAEFIDSDTHLVFGEAVKTSYIDTLQKLHILGTTKFIPVGSSSLDNLAKETSVLPIIKKNSSILYITTFYLNHMYYISTRKQQSTYDEVLWKMQKNILDYGKNYPLMKFVVKIHPSQKKDTLMHQYAANLGIQNVTFVIDEKTIPQLIEDASIIIFDIISTGLLQALTSKKPVFVFSALQYHDAHTLNLLKKRAFVFDTLDNLVQGVEDFLGPDSPRFIEYWGVDYNNTEFLREFGTFQNDGKSAIRAVDVVKEIVKI
jgi:UDP-N-acetylglucosamine transferase subunit ALG13